MGRLNDRLDQIVVTAQSPDGNLTGEARGGGELVLRFAAGSYHRYVEDRLAHQLGQLAALTWVRFHREYDDTVRSFLDRRTEPRRDRKE